MCTVYLQTECRLVCRVVCREGYVDYSKFEERKRLVAELKKNYGPVLQAGGEEAIQQFEFLMSTYAGLHLGTGECSDQDMQRMIYDEIGPLLPRKEANEFFYRITKIKSENRKRMGEEEEERGSLWSRVKRLVLKGRDAR